MISATRGLAFEEDRLPVCALPQHDAMPGLQLAGDARCRRMTFCLTLTNAMLKMPRRSIGPVTTSIVKELAAFFGLSKVTGELARDFSSDFAYFTERRFQQH